MSESAASRAESRIEAMLERKDLKIHFIGILGAGMRPLAKLLAARGYIVSGSDTSLDAEGLRENIKFVSGHDPTLAEAADLVVYSLAIPRDDPELIAARAASVPTVSRPELLGGIVAGFECSVGVAGSHGKSTTTAMLASVLDTLSPTVLCGADFADGGLSVGGGGTVVYEACEYRDAFLSTRPRIAVLLNLDLDHTDYFRDLEALRRSFLRFADSAALTVYNADDENLSLLARDMEGRAVRFGASSGVDYRYEIISVGERTRFRVYRRGEQLGSFSLGIMGAFNLQNALAAIAVASELGVAVENIERGVASYSGLHRRLEKIGRHGGADVLYDYAHHPSEIFSGISAIRAAGYERIAVVFRPHTYSRTGSLWDGFVSSLSLADKVILLDVFAAREKPILGVSSELLADAIGDRAEYADSPECALRLLRGDTADAIVLMGAGDLSEVKSLVLK